MISSSINQPTSSRIIFELSQCERSQLGGHQHEHTHQTSYYELHGERNDAAECVLETAAHSGTSSLDFTHWHVCSDWFVVLLHQAAKAGAAAAVNLRRHYGTAGH